MCNIVMRGALKHLMATIFPSDKEDKSKKEESIVDNTIFSAERFPFTRANILLGTCISCNEPAKRSEEQRKLGNDEWVGNLTGLSYICEKKSCQELWDNLSLDQIRLVTYIRSNFG